MTGGGEKGFPSPGILLGFCERTLILLPPEGGFRRSSLKYPPWRGVLSKSTEIPTNFSRFLLENRKSQDSILFKALFVEC